MKFSFHRSPKLYVVSFVLASVIVHFTAIAPLFSVSTSPIQQVPTSSPVKIPLPNSFVEFEVAAKKKETKKNNNDTEKVTKKKNLKAKNFKSPKSKKQFQTKQSVIQKNNSIKQSPDKTKFLSEKDNQVLEETVAKIRSTSSDSPEVILGKKLKKESSTAKDFSQKANERKTKNTKGDGKILGNALSPKSLSQKTESSLEKELDKTESEKRESSQEEVLVQDGIGSFKIRALKNQKFLDLELGDEKSHVRPVKKTSSFLSNVHSYSRSKKATWSSLSQAFGEDKLDEEREQYASKKEAESYTGQWKQFKAAMENFVPGVKPGNQTALNASASPFASYLAKIHKKIHAEFAERFIANLTHDPTHPFGNKKLFSVYEIQILPSGKIGKAGLIQSSGFLPFDAGTYSALMRAQPFSKPPTSIQSADGIVYIHWGFYRNQRQCGTFNAQPYLIKEKDELEDTLTESG